jgi:hypothetical protein
MARVICEAVEEGRLIRSKKLGYEAPKPRTPEEEAEKNREQAEVAEPAVTEAAVEAAAPDAATEASEAPASE